MYPFGGDVDYGGGYTCIGAGGIGEISVLSLQFAVTSKVL